MMQSRSFLLFLKNSKCFINESNVSFISQYSSKVSQTNKTAQLSTSKNDLDSVRTVEKKTSSSNIDFEDHVGAFKFKTTWELARALIVLRLCAVDMLVDNSLLLMRWTRRLLGKYGLRALVKPIFYDQFVGGETSQEIQDCFRKMAGHGTRPMLSATLEEDLGDHLSEGVHENNCIRILEAIDLSSDEGLREPMIQLKLSGLLSADILVILGNVYSMSDQKSSLVKALAEGFSGYGIKMDAFSGFLADEQLTSLCKAVERVNRIGKEAEIRGVKVLVDSESTYLNPGLSLLTLAAAVVYNQNCPLFWNTYQCYLKNAKEKLKEELGILTEEMDLHFGAKVVRGAYMDHEKNRAQRLNIPDPICEDYAATNESFNSMVSFLLDKVSLPECKCQFVVASHNEESIKLALERMEVLKIDSGNVCFAQLYGMGDQVSYPLAHWGYSVYKSVPFGTLEDVLPYLARRASENKSVLMGTRKEQFLITLELKRRFYSCFRWRTVPKAPITVKKL